MNCGGVRGRGRGGGDISGRRAGFSWGRQARAPGSPAATRWRQRRAPAGTWTGLCTQGKCRAARTGPHRRQSLAGGVGKRGGCARVVGSLRWWEEGGVRGFRSPRLAAAARPSPPPPAPGPAWLPGRCCPAPPAAARWAAPGRHLGVHGSARPTPGGVDVDDDQGVARIRHGVHQLLHAGDVHHVGRRAALVPGLGGGGGLVGGGGGGRGGGDDRRAPACMEVHAWASAGRGAVGRRARARADAGGVGPAQIPGLAGGPAGFGAAGASRERRAVKLTCARAGAPCWLMPPLPPGIGWGACWRRRRVWRLPVQSGRCWPSPAGWWRSAC